MNVFGDDVINSSNSLDWASRHLAFDDDFVRFWFQCMSSGKRRASVETLKEVDLLSGEEVVMVSCHSRTIHHNNRRVLIPV